MITHDLMEAVRLADTVLVGGRRPGRIVHRHSPKPGLARTDAMVYHDTAELLRSSLCARPSALDALVEEGACAAGEFADTPAAPEPTARAAPAAAAAGRRCPPAARRMRCG